MLCFVYLHPSAAFGISKNERTLKLMCSCGVVNVFNGIVKQKKNNSEFHALSRLIGLCQEPDLSPPHVHMLLQRQEGSIHQWPMLSTHTKCFISKLVCVCVCVCVCSCQTTPALLLFSTAYPPKNMFKAESLWAECFFCQLLAFTNLQ